MGYSQAEWLEDPVRWYRRIHPEDNVRWSVEAAEMFLTGKPLRSVYRVIARDGLVVWFHCEAKMVRSDDGQAWFIQGVAFDITQLKEVEAALQEERNFVSAILNTVGTLIIVLDVDGRVQQFNRACEQITWHRFDEFKGASAWDLFPVAEERQRFRHAFAELMDGRVPARFEAHWVTAAGGRRLISWSGAGLADANGSIRHIIATGVDITESKRLENAILEISARELVRSLMGFYGAGLERITEIVFKKGDAGREILDELSRDELMGSLLAANGLHPLDLEARVRRAVERLHPRVRSLDTVELLSVEEGVIRLRLRASGVGDPLPRIC